MNDEKTSTEAEQTKPGDLTDSIERMKAVLEAVEHEVREARFLATGMESGQLKWRTLSRACDRIHDLTSWENYMKNPEVFHTPKENLDFVMANPPLGEVKDAATPLDPTAPEMVRGGGPCVEGHRNRHLRHPPGQRDRAGVGYPGERGRGGVRETDLQGRQAGALLDVCRHGRLREGDLRRHPRRPEQGESDCPLHSQRTPCVTSASETQADEQEGARSGFRSAGLDRHRRPGHRDGGAEP